METNRIDNKIPRRAVHPSEIIKDEIEVRDMSKKEFADRIGMKPSNLSRLLRGDTDITIALAEKLEKALDIPASFWLRMQSTYNSDCQIIAERDIQEQKAIHEEKVLSDILNLKVLFERLNIKKICFVQERLKQLKSIIECDPLDVLKYQTSIYGAFKKSSTATDEKNMRSWLLLAYLATKKDIPTFEYVEGNAEKATLAICNIVHSTTFGEKDIKRILNKYGISYSIVEKLEKTPIDGFSAWINKYPSIVVTHRYNDMSRLVFDVLHELGHIAKHLHKDKDMIFISNGETISSVDNIEKEANRFAEEHLISDEKWERLMRSNIQCLYGNNIVAILVRNAKKLGLNPHIVLWRYRYETQNYALRGIKSIPIT